jgi:hypothetical protein
VRLIKYLPIAQKDISQRLQRFFCSSKIKSLPFADVLFFAEPAFANAKCALLMEVLNFIEANFREVFTNVARAKR